MKTFKLCIIAILVAVMAACKGGGSMTPVSEKIQGPLGEYFEVVTKDYKAKDGKVSIEIKRIKEGLPEPWKEGMEVGYDGETCTPLFSIEFQDGEGNVVGKDAADIISDIDELKAIVALGVDESATITFNSEDDAVKFKMSSTFEVNPKDDSTSVVSDDGSDSEDESALSDDEGEVGSSATGSEDWDSMLDSYEEYVDKYIVLVKKAAKGDMSAMAEYAGLMQKAQDLSDKMNGAQGDMSASQWARYLKITTKMTTAAQEMR